MSFPFYPFESEYGKLVLTGDIRQQVRMDIRAAILTVQEERVMRPTYGRSVQPFDTLSLGDILRDISRAITTTLLDYSDVTFTLQGAIEDSGEALVVVTYTIGLSTVRDSLEVTL